MPSPGDEPASDPPSSGPSQQILPHLRSDSIAWREWLVVALTVVVLVGSYFLLPMRGRWWPVSAIAGPLAIIAFVPLAVRHAKKILHTKHPLPAIVQALVAMLTLLILGFAATYYTIWVHSPEQMVGLDSKLDALYFSVTLLTTVGFGDIHPAGEVARGVATFHMLANLVVVGVSVRVVLWAGRERVQGKRGTEEPSILGEGKPPGTVI